MVWLSAPAATELEGLTMEWLAKLVGLPPTFEGVINDTASSSTLYALAAAREQAWPRAHREGLFGLPRGRVYASEHAHASVEKAVLVLGLGQQGYRSVAADDDFRMDPSALRTALEEDRGSGVRPVAVVATLGTTSSGALDPVAEIADVAADFGTWLHVDAAYGGPAAMLPELEHRFRGWERADSLVLNPHKWLFTPIDCSALYCRRADVLKRAFSIVPEYLRTAETGRARDLMDYGISMGRRFRALKLWFVLRWFGREGLQEVLRGHLALASWLADRVLETPGWELATPVHLGLVCLRHVPTGASDEEADEVNASIMDRVNRSGEAFLSHTRLRGRFVIRVAIGSVRTTSAHVERLWQLLQSAAEAEGQASRAGGA
jgi:aromatic-L-amino-acid decarboxylase